MGSIYDLAHAAHSRSGIRAAAITRDRANSEAAIDKCLTPDEVAERYRGEISVGTLRNWRAMRIGPAFVKIGKAVLYPVEELDAWDKPNLVTCRARTSDGWLSFCTKSPLAIPLPPP
jgi:hypothetical protein